MFNETCYIDNLFPNYTKIKLLYCTVFSRYGKLYSEMKNIQRNKKHLTEKLCCTEVSLNKFCVASEIASSVRLTKS